MFFVSRVNQQKKILTRGNFHQVICMLNIQNNASHLRILDMFNKVGFFLNLEPFPLKITSTNEKLGQEPSKKTLRENRKSFQLLNV